MGLVGLWNLAGLISLLGLVGLVGQVCKVWLIMGTFLLFHIIPKFFQGNISFDDPKEFDELQVADGLKLISNESMDFIDPMEFDDPQAFDNPMGNSFGSMDFDNPKVYCDTSIFDGLVQFVFHLRQCLLNEPEQFEPE